MNAMEGNTHHFNENSEAEIGKELRRRRDTHGITRAKLAGHLGVDARTLARWELEGTTLENLYRATRSLEALRPDMEGSFSVKVNLEAASTLDLALEMASRARLMEERDRRILALKKNLQDAELGYLWPEGL